MKKVKFTPRWGWPRYDALEDGEADNLAATYTREAYERGDVDEWIVILPDLFERAPELREYFERTRPRHLDSF